METETKSGRMIKTLDITHEEAHVLAKKGCRDCLGRGVVTILHRIKAKDGRKEIRIPVLCARRGCALDRIRAWPPEKQPDTIRVVDKREEAQ